MIFIRVQCVKKHKKINSNRVIGFVIKDGILDLSDSFILRDSSIYQAEIGFVIRTRDGRSGLCYLKSKNTRKDKNRTD